jgi:hypothetical protein
MKAEPLTEPIAPRNYRSEQMRGNINAARGFPTKKNFNRYPQDGRPLICDGCAVASKCPMFQAGATCAFRREFRQLDTRDVQAVINEFEQLAQVQHERLMRGLLFESLMNGGTLTREVGREIDRHRKLLELLAKLRKAHAAVPPGLSPDGILARLFGAAADPKSILPPKSW